MEAGMAVGAAASHMAAGSASKAEPLGAFSRFAAGLICAGRPSSCRAIQKCVKFLLGKQNADGGWGEDFASCFNREYAAREKLYGRLQQPFKA